MPDVAGGASRHVHPGFSNVDANIGGFLLRRFFLLTVCPSLERYGLVCPGNRSGSIVEERTDSRFSMA